MASTLDLLKRLSDHGVEYVVVGGMAGVLHGSGMVTEDVDVCAPLMPDNLARLLAAIKDLNPRHRMSPQLPPLTEDAGALAGFKNLYLATNWGQLDILGEITGVGAYPEVRRHAVEVTLAGASYRVLELDALIKSKRALGRPRDLQAARELEAIRERIRGQMPP
jgi:predicted nucleotidyltransferase